MSVGRSIGRSLSQSVGLRFFFCVTALAQLLEKPFLSLPLPTRTQLRWPCIWPCFFVFYFLVHSGFVKFKQVKQHIPGIKGIKLDNHKIFFSYFCIGSKAALIQHIIIRLSNFFSILFHSFCSLWEWTI